jgi:protein-L-isoaspartate(D-aspartate) O-methyltransferase
LKRQLAENGRLIIPVGRTERQQNLIRVIKTGENEFEESDLGAVAFVPLIGDEGW